MREIFTYGSVGRAPGNRCLYPEPDTGDRANKLRLLSRPPAQVSAAIPRDCVALGVQIVVKPT
jgi:hypothetical protein